MRFRTVDQGWLAVIFLVALYYVTLNISHRGVSLSYILYHEIEMK